RLYLKDTNMLRQKKLTEFIDVKVPLEEPVSIKPQRDYLREVYLKTIKEKWKLIYHKELSIKELITNWTIHPYIMIRENKPWIRLSDKYNVDSDKYMILKIPLANGGINTAVDFICRQSKNHAISCIFGDKEMDLINGPGRIRYYLGFFGGPNSSLFDIYKNGNRLAAADSPLLKEDMEYHLRVERTGAMLRILVNGYQVLEHWDDYPLLFENDCYLTLYFYGQDVLFKDIKIYSKPCFLDPEKFRQFGRYQEITLKNNPLQVYTVDIKKVELRGLLANMIIFYDKHRSFSYKPDLKPGTTQARLEKAYNYIQLNFYNHIDFKELAGQSAFCYRYFISSFKKRYGIPPGKFQINLRIQEAARLLKNTPMSAKDIGTGVGYLSAGFFNKAFVKFYAKTPGQYRKLVPLAQ
ncbi:MAG: AraC family transcriptional regulator, partial [bacterium]